MSTDSTPDFWRKCTTCKKLISFGQKYWICSVSTCNRVRTDLVFCDLRCFDAHVPVMNHRDAGAFEKTAPTLKAFREAAAAATSATERRAEAKSQGSYPTPTTPLSAPLRQTPQVSEDEILVVASKVKAYIRERSGMNTSDAVMDVLSDRVRNYCKQAIESANRNQRKTVMDRDF